jgi:hypothetical protein
VNAQLDADFYADVMSHAKSFEHRKLAHDSLVDIFDRYNSKGATLPTLSPPVQIKYSPDSVYQLVSWQLIGDQEAEITFGCLYSASDSSVIKFNDVSKFQSDQKFGSFGSNRWIGAVYTKLFRVPGLDSIWFAFGYNRINPFETLYIIEPINVVGNKVVFGFPLFEDEEGSLQDRLIWKISNGAVNPIDIADSLNRIIAPHLAMVPYGSNQQRSIHVPDGTYEYWEWDGEIWKYHERLYEQRFQELIIDSTKVRQEKRDLFGRRQ